MRLGLNIEVIIVDLWISNHACDLWDAQHLGQLSAQYPSPRCPPAPQALKITKGRRRKCSATSFIFPVSSLGVPCFAIFVLSSTPDSAFFYHFTCKVLKLQRKEKKSHSAPCGAELGGSASRHPLPYYLQSPSSASHLLPLAFSTPKPLFMHSIQDNSGL